MSHPAFPSSHSDGLEKARTEVVEENVSSGHDILVYGGDDKLPPPPILSAQEERRLWRRIDARLVPITATLYLCSFVDRSNIGERSI